MPSSDWKPHTIESGPRKGQSAFLNERTGEVRDQIPTGSEGQAQPDQGQQTQTVQGFMSSLAASSGMDEQTLHHEATALLDEIEGDSEELLGPDEKEPDEPEEPAGLGEEFDEEEPEFDEEAHEPEKLEAAKAEHEKAHAEWDQRGEAHGKRQEELRGQHEQALSEHREKLAGIQSRNELRGTNRQRRIDAASAGCQAIIDAPNQLESLNPPESPEEATSLFETIDQGIEQQQESIATARKHFERAGASPKELAAFDRTATKHGNALTKSRAKLEKESAKVVEAKKALDAIEEDEAEPEEPDEPDFDEDAHEPQEPEEPEEPEEPDLGEFSFGQPPRQEDYENPQDFADDFKAYSELMAEHQPRHEAALAQHAEAIKQFPEQHKAWEQSVEKAEKEHNDRNAKARATWEKEVKKITDRNARRQDKRDHAEVRLDEATDRFHEVRDEFEEAYSAITGDLDDAANSLDDAITERYS